MQYSTRANQIKVSEEIRIYFTIKKYISPENPQGIVPGRFDITPAMGVFKTSKNTEGIIRWFKVEMISTEGCTEFTATEITIEAVYNLLKENGKWLQPDSMNAARSNKYRPVYEWLKSSREVQFTITCKNCGNEQLVDRAKWVNIKLSDDSITCPCGNKLGLGDSNV